MKGRAFLCVSVIVAMCLLLGGNGYSKQKETSVPAEYPADWDVIFQQAQPPTVPLNPGTVPWAKGTTLGTGLMPLPCDITQYRDVPVVLRDGKTIYTDVFVPTNGPERLPAIIAWSPYGKAIKVPASPPSTVPPAWYSGLAKGEGPDAAVWCCNGYAVVNPDARGAYQSEGDIHYWGMVDAADGHDVIEWVAKQDWSNGKVGLHGTSWLAIAQWYIAATQPPHLAAIAPWNGLSDMYRNDVVQGGILDNFFNMLVTNGQQGNNKIEAPYAMGVQHLLMNAYWEDKRAQVENITVPAYVVADGVTTLHRFGALEGFRRLGSKEKWLRINDTNEWNDQYNPVNQADLMKFFDRYLKGTKNGWERTPPVRVAVLDPASTDGLTNYDQVNVPFSSWPLVETQYRKFYLDASDGSLSRHPTTSMSSVSYDAKTGQATFTITFDEDTQVIGYSKLRLWVEADGANDMDLFVLVEKLDSAGNTLVPQGYYANGYMPIPPPGAPGRLKVSLRELDPVKSTHFMPVQSFSENQFLSPGQIVPVDIAIYPWAMFYHKGQQLKLTVAGGVIKAVGVPPVPTINTGKHIIHTGLRYDSYLQLPIIPAEHGKR